MRFGFNLRGDLAKLDLAEIERLMEGLCAERAKVGASIIAAWDWHPALYQKGWAMPFGRGPIHARPFYRLNAFLSFSSWRHGVGRLYVIDCELKDLLDEVRRRHRNAGRSLSRN